MGSVLKGDKIYISKDLLSKINDKERKIILAHEISHWKHKDNFRIVLVRALFFMFPGVVNYFNRRFEMRADREAIKITKDPDSFLSLLDKLQRNKKEYPSRQSSIELANNMRGRI